MIKSKPKNVRLFLPPSPIPFLPTLNESFELLGLPADINRLARVLSLRHGVALPVDSKTLKKAVHDPISLTSAGKITDWLRGFLPNKINDDVADDLFNKWRSLGVLSNGFQWEAGVLYPIKMTGDEELQELRSVRFIKRRLDQEYGFVSDLKAIGDGSVPRSKVESAWRQPLIQHTNIDPKVIDEAFPHLIFWGRSGEEELTPEGCHSVQRLFLHMLIDFYFSVIACLDFDYSFHLLKSDIEVSIRERLVKQGLFKNLAPYQSEETFREPLDRLFEEWRYTLSPTDQHPLTLRDLYRCIPVSPDKNRKHEQNYIRIEDAEADLEESKRLQFRSWRKGKKRPSFNLLDAFVEALVVEELDLSMAILRARWANSLGRFIAREREKNRNSSFPISDDEVLEAFSSYPKYWSLFGFQEADQT
ncbi:hypothetical protein MYE70_00625 [Marinobacter alexandrii]|uniref:hypothetical protein n=1 Tax=Marinobacter alexandrii TaxID=2570351 RepID=UPI001FFF5373|nr:hypothetical protein [Marinobacter alexandrii]MCK2147561.1 hypothetical protein [Marinobacter alexandrii]